MPFEFIFATVPVVDPAPGKPPNNAATKFLFLDQLILFPLCFVLVKLSATTDVSKVSIVPKPAKVNPLTIAILKSSKKYLKTH